VDPRVLGLIPGFWKSSQGFEVYPRVFGVDPRVLELIPGFSS